MELRQLITRLILLVIGFAIGMTVAVSIYEEDERLRKK